MHSKREVNRVVVHCTATLPSCTVATLMNGFKKRGWSAPGYHYVITHDGNCHQLLPRDGIANGAKGYNAHSVHVAYMGGILPGGKPHDTRTLLQRKALRQIIKHLVNTYPDAEVVGHNELNPGKACPCFNVKNEYGKETLFHSSHT
ncbi:MAG: N-acetylmuramoyl-L-alanine amidase [Bacteroidaceae bacterium]|nr:N-acetylmuramoyl-L-alanine amidase [Bacteroidaceae bacterium]